MITTLFPPTLADLHEIDYTVFTGVISIKQLGADLHAKVTPKDFAHEATTGLAMENVVTP